MARNFAALADELDANNQACDGGTHPDIIRAAAALREADTELARWNDLAEAIKAECANPIIFHNLGEQPGDFDSDLDCPHCGGSGHKGDIKGEHLQERAPLTMAGVAALCGAKDYHPHDFGDGLAFTTEAELMAFVGKIERACTTTAG